LAQWRLVLTVFMLFAVRWKTHKTASHPLFRPASSDYGTKPLGDESKLQPPAHPKGGGFSNSFAGRTAQMSGSLRTGVTKHRYLTQLDGMS
jgi:hypothetical protein